MKLLKSKAGFTLIELLVVIGILAVLAAIAIPSVAGLIDRANVSADKTNTNEYTNAIERFASEYELYCQDIASGVLIDTNNDGKPDNMDATQNRVYSVTGITTRNGIETTEIAYNGTINNNIPQLYRDTKYPANAYTLKKIIESYTKTSSSTFEPKQSDMHYWYSPDCGVVIYASPNSSIADKNKMITSGVDAKGRPLVDNGENATIWINLTNGANDGKLDYGSNDPDLNPVKNVPNDAIYLKECVICPTCQWTFADGKYISALSCGHSYNFPDVDRRVYVFPDTPKEGDVYIYGDYYYYYKWARWYVTTIDKNKTSYSPVIESINEVPISSMRGCYAGCANLTNIDNLIIPDNVFDVYGMFKECKNITNIDNFKLPQSARIIDYLFQGCSSVKRFENFVIPSSVKDANGVFVGCSNLEGTITISKGTNLVSHADWFMNVGASKITVYGDDIEVEKITSNSAPRIEFIKNPQ